MNWERNGKLKGITAAVMAVVLSGCVGGGSWVASIDPDHPGVREAIWPGGFPGSHAGAYTGADREAAALEGVLPTQACGNYFLAEVVLDGQGPFLLLLDTGYPRTQLSPRTAQELSASRRLGSIQVGPLQVEGSIPFGVQNLDAIGWALGRPIDGILGYTVFGELVQTYDFPAGEVRVSEAHLPEGLPGVMAMSTGDRPWLDASIGGNRVRLVLDTGYSGAVALAEMESHELAVPPRPVGARVRTDGVSLRHGARLAHSLELGPMVLHEPLVVDATGRSLLGQQAMHQLVVSLDRARGRVRFSFPDGTPPGTLPAEPLRGTGMGLAPRGDHHEVLAVFPGTSADAAGLLEGDAILAMDGVPVAEQGCRDSFRSITDPAQPTVLTVEREGRRFEVEVRSEVLVEAAASPDSSRDPS